MLDIGWSELLVVAVIALLVVGPRELPAMLRTIGKYLGIIKRQAQEFRTQFDEAIRDSEFEQVKKEFEELKSGAEATVREASRDIESEMEDLDTIGRDLDRDLKKSATDTEAGSANSDDPSSADPLDWADEHNRSILESERVADKERLATDAADGDGSAHRDPDVDLTDDEPVTRPEAASAKAGAAT